MPTWPASLPQSPDVDQWVGGPQSNKVSFKPDLGASIDRRRGSATGHLYQATFSYLSDAQRAAFEAWFEDDLYDGTLAFTWDDPVSGVSYDWKFTEDAPPYQFTSHGGEGLHTLSFKIMRLP